MNRYRKIIFVSSEGTCRSILAKAIYKNINKDKHMQIYARGMIVLFSEPVNPKAVAIAKSKGIDIGEETSEQLISEDFNDDTLVLVMTDLLKNKVYEDFENAVNVYSIREFTKEALDVEMAFGGDLSDYGSQYEYLEKLVNKVYVTVHSQADLK